MPMSAIKLSPSTLPLILDRMGIEPMHEDRQNPRVDPETDNLYFIPEFIAKDGYPLGTWMFVDEKFMANCNYDRQNITTRFVTIERK